MDFSTGRAALALIGTLLISTSTQAAIIPWAGTADYSAGANGDALDGETIGPFDSYDFGVGVVLLEAASGSGLPNAPAVNDIYNGYLQTFVSGHSLGLTGVAASNLNISGAGGGYELTLRADFQEQITAVGVNTDFNILGGAAEIYLDATPDYDFNNDSGFTDTGAILTGTIIGGSGTFAGGVLGVTSIDVMINSFDAAVFDPDTVASGSSVFTLQLADGNNNFSGVNSVQGHVFDGGDLLLSADGNLALAAVPVPAAVWLLGSGLLGLVGVARRSRR